MPDQPRLELEAKLKCDGCAASPYLLYRRQNQQMDGSLLPTFEHVIWPASPGIAPPLSSMKLLCPACGRELRRVAP